MSIEHNTLGNATTKSHGIAWQTVSNLTNLFALTLSADDASQRKVIINSGDGSLWMPTGTSTRTDLRLLNTSPRSFDIAYAFMDDMDYPATTPFTTGAVLPFSGLAVVVSGAGSGAAPVAPTGDDEIGVFQITTGTTTTGIGGLSKRFGVNAGHKFTAQSYGVHDTRLRINTLSTAAQEFTCFIGYDVSGAADRFGFLYDRAQSVNWLYVTKASGVETATDTAIPVTAGLIQRFTNVKPNGESAAYGYIDGALVTSGSGQSTNFPSARIGMHIAMTKSAGGTARTADVDWVRGLFCYGGARAT